MYNVLSFFWVSYLNSKLGYGPKRKALFVPMSKEYLTRDINVIPPFRNRVHKIYFSTYYLLGLRPTRHLKLTLHKGIGPYYLNAVFNMKINRSFENKYCMYIIHKCGLQPNFKHFYNNYYNKVINKYKYNILFAC